MLQFISQGSGRVELVNKRTVLRPTFMRLTLLAWGAGHHAIQRLDACDAVSVECQVALNIGTRMINGQSGRQIETAWVKSVGDTPSGSDGWDLRGGVRQGLPGPRGRL